MATGHPDVKAAMAFFALSGAVLCLSPGAVARDLAPGGAPSPAPAAEAPAGGEAGAPEGLALEGRVVRLEGDLAVIDLGAEDGLVKGDRVTLWQALPDKRVRVGQARVVRVSAEEASVGLRRLPRGAVRAGDVVVAEPSGWNDEDPAGEAPAAVPGEAPAAPPPAAVRPAPERPAPVAMPPRAPRPPRVAHDPVSRWKAGTPFPVTVVVAADPPLASATLLWRAGREGEWEEVPLERSGDAGWTATLPGEAVKEGTLSYHVRGRDAAGEEVAVFSGPARPWRVKVEAARDAPGGRRTGVLGSFEWQEFYLAQPGRDAYWRAEVGLEHRPRKGVFDAIRGGFGALEGIGGWRENVEAGVLLSHRALGYAWIEPEMRFGRYVRWIPRLVLGALADHCNECEFEGSSGFERGDVIGGAWSTLEFGPEDVFHVGVKGGFLATVGAEFAVVTTVHAGKGFTAGASVGGTNFPVAKDWAARVEAFAGWNGVPWLSIDLKLGANIRSTDHAGIGGGLGLSFWW